MQDIQNIPNPDVDSFERDEDFGNHSDVHPDSRTDKDSQDMDIERPNEDIPVPPDSIPPAPVEEPPDSKDVPIDEGENGPKRLV